MGGWAYQWQHLIVPVLDKFFFPPDSPDAPGEITLLESAQVYASVYRIVTEVEGVSDVGIQDDGTRSILDGAALHGRSGDQFLRDSLDNYLGGVCRRYLALLQVRDGPPSSLMKRYLDAFRAYKRCISDPQLRTAFSSLERHHNARIRTHNYGWCARPEYADLEPGDREAVQIKELQQKYGLPDRGWTERDRRKAERRAEVLSPIGTPVGLEAMGLRRWRVEVVEATLSFLSDGPDTLARALQGPSLASSDEHQWREVLGSLDQSLEEVGVEGGDLGQIRRGIAECLLV